jgi:hypothetical protein
MRPILHAGIKAFDIFKDYWQQLVAAHAATDRPGNAFVPLRTAFNPMKIHRLLPYIFIVEWKSEDFLEVRLSGTALDDAAGKSLKGSNYLDLYPPGERQFFAQLIGALTHHPCGLLMNRRIEQPSGYMHTLQSLSLPLADSDGKPRYIVGVMNVNRDKTMGVFDNIETARSHIDGYDYMDIGAGTPPLPDHPAPKIFENQ